MTQSNDRYLYPEQRREQVLQRVNHAGQVTVTELSRDFGVSEVTIRGDLQALAEQNLLVRTHGGAVAANRLPEISLSWRRSLQTGEKARIGEAAARHIRDGAAIFLDTSSTSLAIIPHLKQCRDITVLTNSLAIAQALVEYPGVAVVMAGGSLQRDTLSLVGPDGLDMLAHFNIQTGFFGAHGLSYPEGMTDVSAAEADVKRRVIAMCRQVIGVLDSSKWNRVGLSSFARLEDLQCVISDGAPPPELEEQARRSGVEIEII
jgi:DeoR/GlpR family transcriptional regulator of sugar metabolism